MKKAIISSLCTLALAFSINTTSKAEGIKQTRIYGMDRYETSSKIATAYSKDEINSIVVASGRNFPDALSGSVLSKKLNCPILLMDKDFNNSKVSVEYIKTHLNKSGTVYILGGEGSIEGSFVKHLNSLGYKNIERLYGKDRFFTNKAIVDYLNVKEGTPVILANGNNFPDALSVSSAAACKGYPIVLTNTDNIPNAGEILLKNLKPSTVYIIGGVGSFSDKNVSNLKNMLPYLNDKNLVRIQGKDRYETSMNVCKYFSLDSNAVFISSGRNFPDALSGSALAAKYNSPVLLVDDNHIRPQKAYLDSSKYNLQFMLGGLGSVSYSSQNILGGNEYFSEKAQQQEGAISISPRHVYYDNDGTLVMEAYVHNGFNYDVHDIKVSGIELKDRNEEIITSGYFGVLNNLTLKSGETKFWIFRFLGNTTKVKNADITYLQWKTIYEYSK
ncbi:N-acetylmuramoyl-L-alanine amidase LytC precursor [Clostridium acetireducens DSM 10703]|uniref:N-acetylmuramoyl-L-alanine amidase LytC n=1 Tax=Clostridium acetireducens DSM 10703 TaxID=1121290 RepID=A0A1E8EYV2_9CLOT|nr:cell wall-binding repeat-containing protein [Clostridium acetireducens]OFI05872.1 N-acetylmuramoyl-L-alanine amidase LytC precursor [Clostridium acetireducens DSM 10703]